MGIRIAALTPHHHEHDHQDENDGDDSEVSTLLPQNHGKHKQKSTGRHKHDRPSRMKSFFRALREKSLQTTLSLLFAVTTPIGMGIGLTVWHVHADGDEKGTCVALNVFVELIHSFRTGAVNDAPDSGHHVCYISRNADLCWDSGDAWS